jgi:transcriptional regulator with XRE-family HTH domain
VQRTIGERIKDRRIDLGYSQRKMSEKLNIGQSTYSRIERKIEVKNEKLLYELSDILNCAPYELLFPEIRATKLTKEEIDVLNLFNKLPGRMKVILKELMKEWIRHEKK